MKKRGIIIGAAVAVVAIGGFALFGIMRSGADVSAANRNRNAVPAQIEAAKRDTIVTKVSVSGIVDFVDKTTLYAGSGAKAAKVNFKAGDAVKPGDVLVEYDKETLETLERSLADAQLAVRSAEINLKTAKTPTITDAETLAAENGVRNAETGVRSAEKGISDLENQLEQADVNLEQMRRSLETAEDSYRKTKVLFDSGLKSRYELDNAADAITKLEDQIKTAESQKLTLLNSLAQAQSGLTDAEKALAAAQESQSITKRQIAANAGRSANTADLQQVQLEQAQRQVEKLQKDIDDFKEREIVTVGGTLLTLAATEGQILQKGQQIGVVADATWSNLVITTYVPENDTTDVALGQEAEITGGALGKAVYKGKVTKILPVAEKRQIGNAQEAAVTVEITPDDPAIPLKAGYTVDTNIITRVAENVVVAPLMAVMNETGGKTYVFVVTADGKAEKRYVTLNAYSNLYVEAEGINEGESVIITPSDKIADGVAVRASSY